MEERIITFTANEQGLVKTGGISHYASDTISYIKAVFTLGENWQGFDEVRAVFKSPYECRPAVLDSNGECYVPVEVLFYKGKVRVNLVGSIVTETEVTDRLTTYSVEALDVDEDVPICGEESQPISPSEYEQFVAKVANDANRAEQSATGAKTYADEAEASAQNASESASASAVSASDSARSATASAGYAQDASESAISAENAKDDAEDARDEILGMRATAETLEAGSDATASYSDGLLTLGIPRGDRGEQGIQGETGATPNLTIGTVETLEPTEDATASITGTAENPVLNLGLPKGDTGEVSLEDLGALLPTDTASGDIASITDGQSVVPVKSLKVTLEPIQDLHGYDKPWSGGAGKNKLEVTATSLTRSGVTLTVNEDGTIKANGTATADIDFTVGSWVSDGTYIIGNGCPSGGSVSTYRLFFNNVGTDVGSGTAEKKLTVGTSVIARLLIYSGQTVNNLVFMPMIRKSTDSADFAPYSNICPISGHTECVTEVCGKNLFDKSRATLGKYINSTPQEITNPQKAHSDYIKVKPSTSYCMNGYGDAGFFAVLAFDENGIPITWYGGASKDAPFVATMPSNARSVILNFNIDQIDTVAFYESTTVDGYIPYDGNTYTTTLGRTVYGGTLDVVSGELVVDRAMVDLGDLTWAKLTTSGSNYWFRASMPNIAIQTSGSVPPKLVCSQYETITGNDAYTGTTGISSITNAPYIVVVDMSYTDATAFKTAMSGVQLVYELATPQTIQLTPQEVKLLLGTNNVWSDGNVTLVYSADIQRWVEKKLNGNSTTLTMSRPMTAELNETETETAETE